MGQTSILIVGDHPPLRRTPCVDTVEVMTTTGCDEQARRARHPHRLAAQSLRPDPQGQGIALTTWQPQPCAMGVSTLATPQAAQRLSPLKITRAISAPNFLGRIEYTKTSRQIDLEFCTPLEY